MRCACRRQSSQSCTESFNKTPARNHTSPPRQMAYSRISSPGILHNPTVKPSPVYRTCNAPYIPQMPISTAWEKLLTWHFPLNHAHSAGIRKALLRYSLPNGNIVHRATISSSGCQIGKMARAPHRQSTILRRVVTVLFTYVIANYAMPITRVRECGPGVCKGPLGPYTPLGLNRENSSSYSRTWATYLLLLSPPKQKQKSHRKFTYVCQKYNRRRPHH